MERNFLGTKLHYLFRHEYSELLHLLLKDFLVVAEGTLEEVPG